MNDQQRRITEDLTGVLNGELRCDPLTVSMYASDASLYQVPPLGVAFPRDRDDVVQLARYAAENNIPLIGRGSGSGVAGSAVGSGLIVDFSRFMRRVEWIGDDTVRVQPGIVRDRLNGLLRERGRYFPPDPSHTAVTTVGSMLAVDAAGSHSVRVGSTRDHVASIELVMAGGRVIEAGFEPLSMLHVPPETDEVGAPLVEAGPSLSGPDPHLLRMIVSKLVKLLADNDDLIRERQPAGIRNCAGYSLQGVLTETHLQLPRMLVGSEGTLGLFSAATLHTSPLPAHRSAVLVLFGQLEAAIRTVQAIVAQQPSACDLLDRRLLTLAREADPRFADLISPAAEAALLIEQTGLSAREARERIQKVIDAVRSVNLRAVVAREAYTDAEVEFLWSLPSRVVPLLTRLKGPTRPLPFVEDVAVPVDSLHDFLVRSQKVFQKHEVTASLYAHAAAGQLHLRPFLPVPRPEDGSRIEAIARDLYQIVASVGGSISGEHGDGLVRTAFLRSQYGPLYRVFQQVKELFDPHNLMNPGKILCDDPHLTVQNLRPPLAPASDIVGLQLNWKPDELVQAAARCNGCGQCRTHEPDLRMCPFFRVDMQEEASPRSKANLMRNYATGALDAREFTSPAMKRLAGLCFNCKQCQIECPSNTNIPHLMIEAKAAYVAANGLNRADWILSRAHSFGPFGGAVALAANWSLNNAAARWLIEKVFGVARQRKLPEFARRPFIHSMPRELRIPPKQSGQKNAVVYYLGDYANYYDPELARAFVAILRHNGIPVYVPPEQTSSALAMISAGDLQTAREVASENVRVLAELAREGHTIVCTEPSGVLALKQEYPMLLDHPDARQVAAQVVEAGAYLRQLYREQRLRTDFAPLNLTVGYHTPCHLRALGAGTPLEELLTLIPGLRVHRIEEGCSGMAGSYGLTRENFRTSIRIGWGLISRMRSDDLDVGTTECSSCKIQMEQGTPRPTLHPLKLLALSYGLMPEIEKKLQLSKKKLVVT